MDLSDAPMIFFTVVTQMAVGAFLVLGVVRFAAQRGHTITVTERVIAPIVYAIGPAMILGLIVSMFHMHDISHSFFVITHWKTSWLSREILTGCSFAGFGFVYAVLDWFKLGPRVLRQVVAAVAALLGIGLVVSESMIYYSLRVMPAWHTWAVPFQFVATSVLMGCVSVATALMITAWVRLRSSSSASALADAGAAPVGLWAKAKARVAEINAPGSDEEWALTASVTKVIGLVGALTGVAILVAYPLYIGGLGRGNAAAVAAAGVFSGGLFVARLALVAVSVVLLGVLVYRLAGRVTVSAARMLSVLMVVVFVLAIVGEFLGRYLHYMAMIKAGL
jgi:anaerobic dimethyl sulfoxide reductase subunit C (anchor subunit)